MICVNVSMVCSSCFLSVIVLFIFSWSSTVSLNLVQSVFLYVIFVRVRFSRYCPSVVIITGLWSELSAVSVVGLLIVTFLVINRSIVVGLIPFSG
jgi:hypothetical protein